MLYNGSIKSNNARDDIMINLNQYEKRPLFDPIQTHALYGVRKEDVFEVKAELKKFGATRFRVVKSGIIGLVIVCYKAKKS